MTRFCEVARVCVEVIEINNNIKVNSEISDNQSFYLSKDLEFCLIWILKWIFSSTHILTIFNINWVQFIMVPLQTSSKSVAICTSD